MFNKSLKWSWPWLETFTGAGRILITSSVGTRYNNFSLTTYNIPKMYPFNKQSASVSFLIMFVTEPGFNAY